MKHRIRRPFTVVAVVTGLVAATAGPAAAEASIRVVNHSEPLGRWQ